MSLQHNQEAAFILHRYDWSETSLILETFVRQRGRVVVVAKGAKRPSSKLRAVLLPLQAINLTFTKQKQAENLLNLRAAEWNGSYVMPTGAALLAGYELNELLLRLLVTADPHPVLFDLYACAVETLASKTLPPQAVVRAFELHLLKQLGWLPNLAYETVSQQPLIADAYYLLTSEVGLRRVFADEVANSLTGQQWSQLQQALDASTFLSWQLSCHICACAVNPLYQQLRSLLLHYSNLKSLRTRDLLDEVANFADSAPAPLLLRA